jgi:hypothetical protein
VGSSDLGRGTDVLTVILFVYWFYQILNLNVWIQIGDASIFTVLSDPVFIDLFQFKSSTVCIKERHHDIE